MYTIDTDAARRPTATGARVPKCPILSQSEKISLRRPTQQNATHCNTRRKKPGLSAACRKMTRFVAFEKDVTRGGGRVGSPAHNEWGRASLGHGFPTMPPRPTEGLPKCRRPA